MVFAPHNRLTFSGIFGSLSSPYEQWSIRLNYVQDPSIAEPSQDSPINGEAHVNGAQTAFETHVTPLLNAAALLTSVKWARIGADGKYVGDPVINSANKKSSAAPPSGWAPQLSHAVTLDTDKRGASYRGRVFLPAPKSGCDANTGLLIATYCQGVADGFSSFINALQAMPGAGRVVIASSKGYNTPVTSVRVGRALDTIRTRRRDLQESYVGASTALTNPNP